MRICRLFPLSDSVHAGPSVIGEQLILVVLGDLYNRNEKLPLAALKGSRVPGTLKGSMTIQCLCEKLCEKAAFRYQHTFSRARDMVKKAGHDVTKCQMVGMLEQKLRFFPAFKMRSIRNNEKVS